MSTQPAAAANDRIAIVSRLPSLGRLGYRRASFASGLWPRAKLADRPHARNRIPIKA
jgi:hypothetical protein